MSQKEVDELFHIDENGRRVPKHRHEMFYLDENGRPSDRLLHEPILAEGNHLRATRVGRAVAKRIGLSEQDLDESFGPETSDELIRRARATARQLHGLTEQELDEMYGPEPT